MENKKYKIIVRGGYGLTNFGDDALLKCLHEDYFSSFSNDDLAYSCTKVEYLNKYIPDYDIIPLNEEYNGKCDILVYGGGTQFYSFQKNNVSEKLSNNKELIKNPFALFQKIKKVLKRKRQEMAIKPISHQTAAIGIGVGPFLKDSDPKVEEGISKLFQNMNFVGVRDVFSETKCKEWKVINANLYSDLCFKMDNPLFFKDNEATFVKNVGIVVRDWKRTKEGGSYRESLIKFVENISNQNFVVTFFVFAKESDSEWVTFLDDNNINYELWNPDLDSFDDYLKRLSLIDVFITARYHGAIFSSMLGKPFITIEVEQKLRMFSKLIDCGSKNWSYPFSEIDLHDKFLEINQNYREFSTAVIDGAKKQKTLAEKMAEDLNSYLKLNI